MSLVELEQVAREAGIDPAMVRRAAAEVERGGRAVAEPAPLLGAPVRLVTERVIAGELRESSLAAVLDAIQRETDDPGQPRGIGGVLVWHSSPPLQYARARWHRRLSLRVTPRDGATTVRVEESIGDAAGGIFGAVSKRRTRQLERLADRVAEAVEREVTR